MPKDSDGKEFWENLPVEKQDRVALPAPTAEMIEDMHWQLVPELSEESFSLMLQRHPNGRLPGADCNCKACLVHQGAIPLCMALLKHNTFGLRKVITAACKLLVC